MKASLVFIDPPFGFNLAEWDGADNVWTADYWFDVFSSLADYLLDSAAIVVFGDCFNVLPELLAGVKLFNEDARENQNPILLPPIQICFQKINHPHKGGNNYSQSVENAFVFHYQSTPKIKKNNFELAGNLLTSSRVTGARRILNEEGTWMNPCQKSQLWLRYFIDNNTVMNSLVLDLTAGSFSSYLACFYSTRTLHWAGCDIGPNTLKNWEFLRSQLEEDCENLKKFYQGIYIHS